MHPRAYIDTRLRVSQSACGNAHGETPFSLPRYFGAFVTSSHCGLQTTAVPHRHFARRGLSRSRKLSVPEPLGVSSTCGRSPHLQVGRSNNGSAIAPSPLLSFTRPSARRADLRRADVVHYFPSGRPWRRARETN